MNNFELTDIMPVTGMISVKKLVNTFSIAKGVDIYRESVQDGFTGICRGCNLSGVDLEDYIKMRLDENPDLINSYAIDNSVTVDEVKQLLNSIAKGDEFNNKFAKYFKKSTRKRWFNWIAGKERSVAQNLKTFERYLYFSPDSNRGITLKWVLSDHGNRFEINNDIIQSYDEYHKWQTKMSARNRLQSLEPYFIKECNIEEIYVHSTGEIYD